MPLPNWLPYVDAEYKAHRQNAITAALFCIGSGLLITALIYFEKEVKGFLLVTCAMGALFSLKFAWQAFRLLRSYRTRD